MLRRQPRCALRAWGPTPSLRPQFPKPAPAPKMRPNAIQPVTPMRPLSNFAARDVETPAASHHQPPGAPQPGSAGAGARRGRLRLRHRRQALHRGPRGPVVHGARLRQRRAGRGRARADAAPLLLAPVRRPQPRAGHRAGREDQGHVAGPDLQGVLHQLGLGGQRHADQDRLVLQQRDGAPEEEEDHLAPARLPRHHHRARPACRGSRCSTPTSTCRWRASSTPTARTTASMPSPARPRRSTRAGWRRTSRR